MCKYFRPNVFIGTIFTPPFRVHFFGKYIYKIKLVKEIAFMIHFNVSPYLDPAKLCDFSTEFHSGTEYKFIQLKMTVPSKVFPIN